MDQAQVSKAFVDCYKYSREIADSDAADEHLANECDEICNGILRALHELDLEAYQACICWDVDRARLTHTRQPG